MGNLLKGFKPKTVTVQCACYQAPSCSPWEWTAEEQEQSRDAGGTHHTPGL